MLIQIHTGGVEVVVTGKTKVYQLPPQMRSVPGGLYPMKSAAFEVDEYRLMDGWPVPVPSCDIHCPTLVSGDGTKLMDRESPTSVLTGADYRWIADTNFYDQTALLWSPIQGGEPFWTAPVNNLPSLITNYEYTVNDERFVGMTALNFDSDTADYLTTDLSRVMSTQDGYTVIMVMSPNSVYGNNEDVKMNALWCNPPDPLYSDLQLFLKDDLNNAAFLYTRMDGQPDQQGIAMAAATSISAPSFLALVLARPSLYMYLSQGPQNIASKKLNVGPSTQVLSGEILLGKWPADNVHGADMALFDLGLYGNPLSAAQVKHEFSLLSKIYGGI